MVSAGTVEAGMRARFRAVCSVPEPLSMLVLDFVAVPVKVLLSVLVPRSVSERGRVFESMTVSESRSRSVARFDSLSARVFPSSFEPES